MSITDPCAWRLDLKPIKTEQGDIHMMIPGCDQRAGWGRWYYEQWQFCPFCGHPIDHSNDNNLLNRRVG